MTIPKFKGKYRVESTRLLNRNYAANGWYFITICTRDRFYLFGDVISGEVQLSAIGEIAQQFWADIPNHFAHTHIDAYAIMPNHIHGIVVIDRPPDVETRHGASLQNTDESNKFAPLKRGSLQAIINAYKSSVTRWCRKNGHDYFGWQSRFYDHIIRADDSLDRIREYIINNPAKWEEDKDNPANLWM
ncbi:transposase [Fischerella sp. PCC 9605]|uniref:transposase n=1 Tax=Fischerella sp. PCC 9605 TaxID=1173024 RepID=UPI00047A7895